jgi:hypothetical protein
MIEPQSESSLPPPLKARGARPARRTNSLAGGGVMKLDQGFAEGKRTMPGPGRDKYERRRGSLLMRQA